MDILIHLIAFLWRESGASESLVESGTERERRRQAAGYLRRAVELAAAGRIHEAQIRLEPARQLDPRAHKGLSRKSRGELVTRLWDVLLQDPDGQPEIKAMLLWLDPA